MIIDLVFHFNVLLLFHTDMRKLRTGETDIKTVIMDGGKWEPNLSLPITQKGR